MLKHVNVEGGIEGDVGNQLQRLLAHHRLLKTMRMRMVAMMMMMIMMKIRKRMVVSKLRNLKRSWSRCG